MIVKVQASLRTNNPKGQQGLIYNEDCSVMWEGPITEDILKRLNGKPKMFFYAHLGDKKTIQLDSPAPWQEW